jgi:hypothetical protein
LFGSRRWQKRWFALHGRVLRYFKQPPTVLTSLGASMDTAAREQLKYYSARGAGTGKRAPLAAKAGVQSGAGSSDLGAFDSGEEATRIVAHLRSSDIASTAAAANAQGSHMQRAAMTELAAPPKTVEEPLARIPLYGGWVRCVERGTAGFVDSGILLLPAEGNRVFELSAPNDEARRLWIAAFVAAGCREVTD